MSIRGRASCRTASSLNSRKENMRKNLSIVLLVTLVLCFATAIMAADPFIGTWKLNVEKSKFSSPAPRSEIIKITAQGNGCKWAFDTVDAEGKATHMEWAGIYDGKDHAVTNDPNGDTAATTKIDANTLDSVGKKGDKIVDNMHIVVSKDGRTMTLNQKVKNQKGEDVHNTYIFDRQ
jgi:hypothetical protein